MSLMTRSALLLACVLCLLIRVPVNQAQSTPQPDPSFWADLFTYQDPDALLASRKPKDIVLMATGDVLLARTINARMVTNNDFTFPFEHVKDFLSQGDITWVNLETPLVTDCPLRYKGMRFCGDPRTVAGLLAAGIDVANMANNHAENHGEAGVLETEQILTDAGIEITGRSKPVILTIHGKKIGLLGFTDVGSTRWISSANEDVFEAQIKALRPQVDYLVVAFHWGIEYRLNQNSHQRNKAKRAIDAGADLVIGHHPHWLEGVEVYKGKPILYSLGNFIFDQKEGGWVNEGAVAVINFQTSGDLKINFVPVMIEDSSTPRIANQDEAERILRRIASASTILED